MVTFIFLLFVAMFAVAGFFISLEAKRRNDSQAEGPMAPRSHAPKMGRASSDGERVADSHSQARRAA
jgi:hypothetical protein